MIDWDDVCDNGFGVPDGADLDKLTAELAECLRDPDPVVRDGAPYVALRTWIARDVIAGQRRLRLGDPIPRAEAVKTRLAAVLDRVFGHPPQKAENLTHPGTLPGVGEGPLAEPNCR